MSKKCVVCGKDARGFLCSACQRSHDENTDMTIFGVMEWAALRAAKVCCRELAEAKAIIKDLRALEWLIKHSESEVAIPDEGGVVVTRDGSLKSFATYREAAKALGMQD